MSALNLCLDLGTKTGWATDSGSLIHSGTISFATGRYEGGGMRYLRFRRWLEEIAASPITAVYFEEVRRHAGTDAVYVYGGLLAVLIAWCEERGTPYQGIPVGTIKRHATTKGNANKDAMIEAAKDYGHNPKDDNEADAICLAYCVRDLK